MERKVVEVARAKTPTVPLSWGIKANGVVYCSGQLPVHLDTGELVEGDVRTQTRQVLENLKRVLAGAGSGLDKVLKATIYLTEIGDFAAVNEVYREYFLDQPPARTTVAITALARPGAHIEIDLIALA